MKVIIIEGDLLDDVSKNKLKKVLKEMNHKPDVKVRIILNSMGLVFPYVPRNKKWGMTLKEMLEIRKVARA
jgi:phage pi2 protein 07